MAKDDATVRCFQGLLIFGNVIVGVSNEYFSGNLPLPVIMILSIKSESLKENNYITTGSLHLSFILRTVLLKYAS